MWYFELSMNGPDGSRLVSLQKDRLTIGIRLSLDEPRAGYAVDVDSDFGQVIRKQECPRLDGLGLSNSVRNYGVTPRALRHRQNNNCVVTLFTNLCCRKKPADPKLPARTETA